MGLTRGTIEAIKSRRFFSEVPHFYELKASPKNLLWIRIELPHRMKNLMA